MKVEYSVNGGERKLFLKFDYAVYRQSNVIHQYLINCISMSLYNNRDVDMDWPIEIELFVNDNGVDKYCVNVNIEPTFTASKIE